MRYIKEISHPAFRMGLYAWNNKYIVKIEAGLYEQTYKISELDVNSDDEVIQLLDEPFMQKVNERFGQMHEDFMEARQRNEF
ncbi:hypothetical protein GCM10028803_28270 [Larkinella knui]|uniref:Uncharacterized protein n=1 Tax=Larkinella knui TaxID=2025310 RepID=A0A3P1CXR2_9BACT|nr:hypothetical protein [Larkinella knui]RRB17866.1 hypothetical protein EHT87_06210 [Larkinella knui]